MTLVVSICSSSIFRERSLANAAASAKAIMNGRGIIRVVVVDDDVSPPSWYGLVELLESEDRAHIGQETGCDLLTGDWQDQLNLADRETRGKVARLVTSTATEQGIACPPGGPGDPALRRLQEILKSHQPEQLTPDQWQARSGELIERAKSQPTLFLVDERLGHGRRGGRLVTDLLPRGTEGCFFCILTNEINDIRDEFDYWQTMCNTYGVEPGQVGIVAKRYLTHDPDGFARMLKISLTAGEVKEVRDRVLDAARSGLSEALTRFDELDLQTLTSLVFSSSKVEGAWELETILRVVKAFVRDSIDNRVYGDQNVVRAVKEIAAAASVDTGDDERLKASAFEIQHLERYVTGDYLSKHRIALANGDIFEVNDMEGHTSLWVLVAQPCDLAIRSDGKRSGSPTHLSILPVEQTEKVPRGANVELLHYLPPGTDRAFVRLAVPSHVPTAILDLAAFSATGAAVWTRGSEADAMQVVGWTRRAAKVYNHFDIALQRQDYLNVVHGRICELRVPAAERPEIRPSRVGNTIKYPIRRIGRLRERQAETVLQAFGLALSRTAEAHDLARISS